MVYVLLAILRFQRRLKKYMEGRRAVMKLIVFKLFVAIQVLQRVSGPVFPQRGSSLRLITHASQFIFNIISTQVHGGAKVTYRDISIGIPALLTSIEALIFTIGFYFTFHSKEYQDGTAAPQKNYGGFRAFLHALSPGDLIRGVIIAFTPWKMPNAGNHDNVAAKAV